MSKQTALKVVRSVVCTGHFYSLEIFLVLISVTDWVDPRALVQLEGLCQCKIAVTPPGIEPLTFQLVFKCLNQLQHCVPHWSDSDIKTKVFGDKPAPLQLLQPRTSRGLAWDQNWPSVVSLMTEPWHSLIVLMNWCLLSYMGMKQHLFLCSQKGTSSHANDETFYRRNL